MKQYEIQFSESNSGARYRLDKQDWQNLYDHGWNVDPDVNVATKFFPASSESVAYDAAVSEWEELTGFEKDDPGCNCCGMPFSFSIGDVLTAPASLNEFITWLQESGEWSNYLDGLVLEFERDTGLLEDEDAEY